MSQSAALKLPDSNSKEFKYDRQLRLWGDHGQKALETAHICLIGANCLGTEILKSLILPGIGHFTIIDNQLVTHADLGTNFFLESNSIGQPRAQVTCELLNQLNPDVSGDYLNVSLEDILKQQMYQFDKYQCVVLANTLNISQQTLLTLANRLWSAHVPLIVCRTNGFIGQIRLQVREHYVIEAHPDDTIPDLRLDHPISEFLSYCNNINFLTLKREEHGHLPSLVILFKTLQLWQHENKKSSSDLPRTRQEKDNFKKIITQLSKHPEHDEEENQSANIENFEEAKRTMLSRLVETKLSPRLKELFQDQQCLQLTQQSNLFWFLIAAIKQFVENEGHGFLPLRGILPDMICDSKSYIDLLTIYQEKARKDCELVGNYLYDLLQKYCSKNVSSKAQLDDLVSIYCKNSSFLNVVRTSELKQEYRHENNESLKQYVEQLPAAQQAPSDGDQSESMMTPQPIFAQDCPELCWYIGLRLCDLFHEKYGRYPGEQLKDIQNGSEDDNSREEMDTDQRQIETDLHDLKLIGKQFLTDHELAKHQGGIRDTVLEELCRYGSCEIHSIAAFVGGCCAQEIIKLITHQYIPIDNTFIYNGIKQSTALFKF